VPVDCIFVASEAIVVDIFRSAWAVIAVWVVVSFYAVEMFAEGYVPCTKLCQYTDLSVVGPVTCCCVAPPILPLFDPLPMLYTSHIFTTL